jgi:hypothetical protein
MEEVDDLAHSFNQMAHKKNYAILLTRFKPFITTLRAALWYLIFQGKCNK